MASRTHLMGLIRKKAAEHEDGCECRTCRAANGDEDAQKQLLKHLG